MDKDQKVNFTLNSKKKINKRDCTRNFTPCKYGNTRFTMVAWKADFILNCGFSTEVTCIFILQKIMKELSELKLEKLPYPPHY